MSLFMLAVDRSVEVSAKEQTGWMKVGVSTVRVDTMEEAIELLQRRSFIFTAINADNIDYKPLLGEMRNVSPSPIFIITSNFTIEDQTEALRLGANGYTRFNEDVDANVKSALALIKRYNEHYANHTIHRTVLIHGNLVVSTISRKAYIHSQEIKLTTKEFDLLQMLMTHPEQVYTYAQLFEHIWGDAESYGAREIVWACMHRLREKLKADPIIHNYIRTVQDVGYSFDPDD